MTPRIGMLPKAITLVPLAALSAVWTVQVVRTPAADMSAVAGPAPAPATSAAPPAAPTVPDSALVVPPDTRSPASVWGGAARAAGKAVLASPALAAPEIPAVALAAYQRAATVIDTADRTCRLDWSLLAAIGRVESGHGSHAGSRLSDAGLASPGIVGPALTGRAGTLRVADTDAGALDGDARFDHAVGPMQFLPSTWATVGVDADGDGQRNPQDVDDAALAAAVYLCSGAEDLATPGGRQAALLRYNHSASYVNTVLRIAAAYQSGAGLDTGLTGTFAAARAVSVVPALVLEPEAQPVKTRGHKRHKDRTEAGLAAQQSHAVGSGGHHGTTQGGPSAGTAQPPAGQPSQPPTDLPDGPGGGTTEPPAAATAEELSTLCGDRIAETYPDATDEAVDAAVTACVEQLTADGDPTLAEASAQVDDIVDTLSDTIDGLEPATEPTTDPSTDPSTDPTGPTENPTTDPTGPTEGPTDPTSTEAGAASATP